MTLFLVHDKDVHRLRYSGWGWLCSCGAASTGAYPSKAEAAQGWADHVMKG